MAKFLPKILVDISNAKTAVYSYGHRNPQGMIKHPETGEIWTHEHGPRGGDEINIIQAGKTMDGQKSPMAKTIQGLQLPKTRHFQDWNNPVLLIPSIAPSGMALFQFCLCGLGRSLVVSPYFNYLERLTFENNVLFIVRRSPMESVVFAM